MVEGLGDEWSELSGLGTAIGIHRGYGLMGLCKQCAYNQFRA